MKFPKVYALAKMYKKPTRFPKNNSINKGLCMNFTMQYYQVLHEISNGIMLHYQIQVEYLMIY